MEQTLATSKATALAFKARRRQPELISPAKPTPRELKILSDIDDMIDLRVFFRTIFFYRHNPSSMIQGNPDPVQVIRKALAETLVYYYPFAGRLREHVNGKLMVECNAEGVLFVEADADVALHDFGEDLRPPFPCSEELLFDAKGPLGFLDSPLLLLQVTRLKCGSFILGLNYNHVMCDATGQRLFLRTLEEFARGSNAPSIPPVWDRHLLTAKVPPHATPAHLVSVNEGVHDARVTTPHDPMVQRSFLFGPGAISAIRRLVPPGLRDRVTTFELLASFLWRCRTIALNCRPETETRLSFAVNARPFLRKPQLPPGYYGNAVTSSIAKTTTRELLGRPLEFAVRLVQEAKSCVTEEWFRSMIGQLGTEDWRNAMIRETYFISDLRRIGRDEVDLGWGPPVYAGLVDGGVWGMSWLIRRKNKTGEAETVVQVMLPEPAMERFVEELAPVLERGESTSR